MPTSSNGTRSARLKLHTIYYVQLHQAWLIHMGSTYPRSPPGQVKNRPNIYSVDLRQRKPNERPKNYTRHPLGLLWIPALWLTSKLWFTRICAMRCMILKTRMAQTYLHRLHTCISDVPQSYPNRCSLGQSSAHRFSRSSPGREVRSRIYCFSDLGIRISKSGGWEIYLVRICPNENSPGARI